MTFKEVVAQLFSIGLFVISNRSQSHSRAWTPRRGVPLYAVKGSQTTSFGLHTAHAKPFDACGSEYACKSRH